MRVGLQLLSIHTTLSGDQQHYVTIMDVVLNAIKIAAVANRVLIAGGVAKE